MELELDDSDFKVGLDFPCFEEEFVDFFEVGDWTDMLLVVGGFVGGSGLCVVVLLEKAAE